MIPGSTKDNQSTPGGAANKGGLPLGAGVFQQNQAHWQELREMKAKAQE